jgi:hypothetical protein
MQKNYTYIIPRWVELILLILSLIPLLYFALNNEYPLLYPDSGTYILSGHKGYVPVDRPLMYGLFVRHMSMSYSLWFVVIAQAVLVWIILILTARSFWPDSWINKSVLIIICLSFFTGISCYISQIMPDIFTSLIILSFFLFLFYLKKSKFISILLGIFIIFCNMVHFSNLIISTILVFLILFVSLISKNKLVKIKHVLLLLLVIAVTWIFGMTFNYMYGAGFSLSRASNVFFIARWQETGLVSEYLNDQCGTRDIPLCEFKKDLPIPLSTYLWCNSPLYNNVNKNTDRWDSVWLEKNKEYAPIARDIITTPKYLKRFVSISISETMLLLTKTYIDDLPNSITGTPILWMIEWQYKRDLKQFNSSNQALSHHLQFGFAGFMQTLSVILSLIGILIITLIRKLRRRIPSVYYLLLIIISMGTIINAWVCTTFSTMVTRFQSRMIWLIPLVFLVLIILILKKQPDQNSKSGPIN